jgi:hypothetical protein
MLGFGLGPFQYHQNLFEKKPSNNHLSFKFFNDRMCFRKKEERKTYHSELKDGTLNTPQWMKMPTLLASYHAGNGRASNEAQSGVYFCPVTDRRQHGTTAAITRVVKESISVSNYLQNSASGLNTRDDTC